MITLKELFWVSFFANALTELLRTMTLIIRRVIQ